MNDLQVRFFPDFQIFCVLQIVKINLFSRELGDAFFTIDLSNLKKQVNKNVEMCVNLPSLWDKASFHKKMELQNLVFPEGIFYDRKKDRYRTPKINSVVFAMSLLASSLGDSKKKKTAISGGLSGLVVPTGIEPVTQGFSVLCSTN